MKRIVTHPDNLKYVQAIAKTMEKDEVDRDKDFIHFIKPFGIEVTTNLAMEKLRWSGKWRVLQNDFFTYWDGKGEPPSWCLYFGFVEKEMVPNFVILNDSAMTLNFNNKIWTSRYFDFGVNIYQPKKLMLNNFC